MSLDSTKIKEVWQEGGPEADESTNIFLVDVQQVKEDNLESGLVKRLTPHAKGSIQLLKQRLAIPL